MKKLCIVLSLFILFLFFGCDENVLRNVNFGYAGNEEMARANELTNSFLQVFEENISYTASEPVRYRVIKDFLDNYHAIKTNEDADCEIEPSASFVRVVQKEQTPSSFPGIPSYTDIVIYDGEAVLEEHLEKLVISLNKAVQSSASDYSLKRSFGLKYTGKTSAQPKYRDLYTLITHSEIYINDVLPALSLYVMDTEMLDSFKEIELPMPLQVGDLTIIYPKARKLIHDYSSLLKQLISLSDETSSGGTEGESPTDSVVPFLNKLLSDFRKHVGDRSYQTTGDKIAVCLLDLIFIKADAIFSAFTEAGVDENLFSLTWVLENCGQEVTVIENAIRVIEYIYDYPELIVSIVLDNIKS